MPVSENHTPTPDLLTVRQFSERHPAFSESALRALIFDCEPRSRLDGVRRNIVPANGFRSAFVRLGRRVLIDATKFFEIVRERNSGGIKRGSK